jgi:hypothetical protein
MSEFDFILDSLKFSFSSTKTYETCHYAFKLTYIEALERGNNFYGQYGSFVHLILEKYFKDELDFFELEDFYKDHYYEHVQSQPPAFQPNIAEDYYNKGLEYFSNFSFDKSKYNILLVEDALYPSIGDLKFIAKPDLILQEKETGKNILVDFKTANAYKNGKLDKKKMAEYMKQFLIYAWSIWSEMHVEINEINVWFINCGKIEIIPVDVVEEQMAIKWFTDTIEKIKQDDSFPPNVSSSFFCSQLCSVSEQCQYKFS